jgi:hypothetical protein
MSPSEIPLKGEKYEDPPQGSMMLYTDVRIAKVMYGNSMRHKLGKVAGEKPPTRDANPRPSVVPWSMTRGRATANWVIPSVSRRRMPLVRMENEVAIKAPRSNWSARGEIRRRFSSLQHRQRPWFMRPRCKSMTSACRANSENPC